MSTRDKPRAKGIVHSTFEVILNAGVPGHARGDIIDVFRTNRMSDVVWDSETNKYTTVGGIKMRVTGYVHVRNVPTDVFTRLRRLTKQKFNPPIHVEDPHSGGISHRRRWQYQISELATPVREELLNNREVTRNWLQFKNTTKHKIQDRYLTDSDIGETDTDLEA